jgi:hypothetical protein
VEVSSARTRSRPIEFRLRTRWNHARVVRTVFVVVLGSWLLQPFLTWHQPAQDSIPMTVASRLAEVAPDAVYARHGGIEDPTPPFRALACTYFTDEQSCANYIVSFISSPLVIPLIRVFPTEPSPSFFAFRMSGVLAMIGAMTVLWRRLTARSAAMAVPLVVIAVCLTPMVALNGSIGQTSPVLVLAAACSMAGANRTRLGSARYGALLTLASAFKVFPIVVLVVPTLRARWRPIIATFSALAALAMASVALLPERLWPDFGVTARAVARSTSSNPFNGSLGAALHDLGWSSPAAEWLLRAVVVVAVAAMLRRLSGLDAGVALVWVAVLVVFPQVWGHYAMVIPIAMASLAACGVVDRKATAAVIASAASTVPIAVIAQGADGAAALRWSIAAANLVVAMALAARIARSVPQAPSCTAATVSMATRQMP